MNIKIVAPIPEHLITHSFPFGSHVYGTARPDSDLDCVKFVRDDMGSLILQYQDEAVDYLYTDSKNFFKHLENGASCVNFEILHTKAFQDAFPTDPFKYYTVTMAKCFLGFAKRDSDYTDRITHVNRSIYIAEKIMNKELLVLSDIGKLEINNDLEFLRDKTKALRTKLFQGK